MTVLSGQVGGGGVEGNIKLSVLPKVTAVHCCAVRPIGGRPVNRTCSDVDLVCPGQPGLGRGDDAAVVPTVRLQQVVNAQQETLQQSNLPLITLWVRSEKPVSVTIKEFVVKVRNQSV